MLRITITGLDDIVSGIRNFKKEQLPYAMATTLTELSKIGKDNMVKHMRTDFDRPTPYTLNAFKYIPAKKTTLESKVVLKDSDNINDTNHFLHPAVSGGSRSYKNFEKALYRKGILPPGFFAVPANAAELDAYGNFPRSKIVQILAYFDAFPSVAGWKSNMGDKGRTKLRKKTKKKDGISYFAIRPDQHSKLPPGIYRKTYGVSNIDTKIVFFFTQLENYSVRINLDSISKRTYDENFKSVFLEKYQAAVSNAF